MFLIFLHSGAVLGKGRLHLDNKFDANLVNTQEYIIFDVWAVSRDPLKLVKYIKIKNSKRLKTVKT